MLFKSTDRIPEFPTKVMSNKYPLLGTFLVGKRIPKSKMSTTSPSLWRSHHVPETLQVLVSWRLDVTLYP